MTCKEAKLANAASIEMYAQTMVSKGLHGRAQWAFTQARKIRMDILISETIQPAIQVSAAA